jgi:P27 family predicted phage terminase small subunit
MSLGGHNIKSVKDHKNKGNYRPSRHDGRLENGAKVLNEPPPPPKTFDKRHKDLWQTTCKQVFDLGVLVEPDIYLIETFVIHWFLWQDAVKSIQDEGYTIMVEGEKGMRQISNPALRVMNESVKIFSQIADKFGFSPRARMSIKTQEQAPKDPLAGFLSN